MKAYEEWVYGGASDDWIGDEFTGAEEAWRAALEWVKEHYVELGIDDCTIIDEELERME